MRSPASCMEIDSIGDIREELADIELAVATVAVAFAFAAVAVGVGLRQSS